MGSGTSLIFSIVKDPFGQCPMNLCKGWQALYMLNMLAQYRYSVYFKIWPYCSYL